MKVKKIEKKNRIKYNQEKKEVRGLLEVRERLYQKEGSGQMLRAPSIDGRCPRAGGDGEGGASLEAS